MVEDKISNLINSLKTASAAGKNSAEVSSSKLNVAILDILKKNEYIDDYEIVDIDDVKKRAVVDLKYNGKNPVINGMKRISKLSKRVYKNTKDIQPVKRGFGIMVMTTSKGLMTGEEAKKANLGGEALFQVW